jgi:hypothetical protein
VDSWKTIGLVVVSLVLMLGGIVAQCAKGDAVNGSEQHQRNPGVGP